MKMVNSIEAANGIIDEWIFSVVYPVPFASPDVHITVQAAVWSPRSNALAYVAQNDIFYLPDVTDTEAERLTTNGAFNAIYNGIADWTYQGV